MLMISPQVYESGRKMSCLVERGNSWLKVIFLGFENDGEYGYGRFGG